jgi:hypothetical protein
MLQSYAQDSDCKNKTPREKDDGKVLNLPAKSGMLAKHK